MLMVMIIRKSLNTLYFFPPPAPIRAQMVFTDFEQLHQRTTKKNISHVDIR